MFFSQPNRACSSFTTTIPEKYLNNGRYCKKNKVIWARLLLFTKSCLKEQKEQLKFARWKQTIVISKGYKPL